MFRPIISASFSCVIFFAILSRRTFAPNFLICWSSSGVRGTGSLQTFSSLIVTIRHGVILKILFTRKTMKKDRDLLDYLSVGSQLFQNVQLSGLQHSLAVLGGVEAEKLHTERVENQIRQFVFESTQIVRKLREDRLQSAPTGTLLTALNLDNIIRSNQITITRVRSFEDKERVQQLLDETSSLIKDAEGRMDVKTRDSVRKAAAYKAEESNLRKLIILMSEYEGRQKQRTEYEALPKKSAMPPLVAYILIAGAACAGMVLLRQNPFSPDALAGVILSIVFVLVGMIGLVRTRPHGSYKLKLQIKQAEESFAMRGEAQELSRLRNQFGKDKDLAGYRKLQAKRKKLVDSFLKEPQAVRT
jgi:hypothetical protein